MDASALVQSIKLALFLVNLGVSVFNYIKSIVLDHDLLLGADVLLVLNGSLVKVYDLPQLVLLPFSGVDHDGLLEQVCDVEAGQVGTRRGI